MGEFLALGFLTLVWFGSKNPRFRALAILIFTLECLLFREDSLSTNDVGFWVIVAMTIIGLLFWVQDRVAKTKKM